MAIQAKDLMDCIIRPALSAFGVFQDNVAQQLMGTAAQESQMGSYLKQIEGPALGIWQMEPKTHFDIHKNFLSYRKDMRSDIYKTCGMVDYGDSQTPPDSALITNLSYACLMARIKYLRCKDALPAFGDTQAQAIFWKNNYNSGIGKGDTEAYMINYERFLKTYYIGYKQS